MKRKNKTSKLSTEQLKLAHIAQRAGRFAESCQGCRGFLQARHDQEEKEEAREVGSAAEPASLRVLDSIGTAVITRRNGIARPSAIRRFR
jgi:hypothetical protein